MGSKLAKLSFAFSLAALVVVVLGTTALGSAAGNAVQAAANAPLKAAGLKSTEAKPRRGPRGRRGFRGPRGFRGLQGIQGLKGDKGDKGDTGTVDTSNFFTKSQSDSRYAPATALGTTRLFSGLDFNTVISTTTWDTTNYVGKFETAGGTLHYLFASLNSLPTGAAITSVDFYVKHNVAGNALVYLSQSGPSAGTEFAWAGATVSTADPAIRTVTVTPASPVVFGPDVEGLLFWLPSAQSANDVIYGAKVYYNPPTP